MVSGGGAWVLTANGWERKGRTTRAPVGLLGPRPSAGQLVPQVGGTVRNATNAATLTSALASSVAGDTITLSAGSYGAFATAKSIASGFIRIIPVTPGTVTFGRVDLSGAQGLEWLGINTTDEVYYASGSRIRWRWGTFSPTSPFVPTGHNIRESCSDLWIADNMLSNADCSFFLYAGTDAAASTNVLIEHNRSENVGQDHVFGSRGTFVTIRRNELFGHTEDVEHQDGVQVVGLKDWAIVQNHIWHTRAFRDAASDRNDHGVMINYTPGEGRVPERGLVENNLMHDLTSTAISVAGGLALKFRHNTCYDVGAGGSATAVIFAPDAGNTITVDELIGNVLESFSSTGATITTNSYNFVADGSGPAGTNRLTGAPGFVDAANADYRLSAASQLRGSGTPSSTVVDLYSRTRPTPPSRGAIEYAA